jgi:methyl-accepting chemotaxis protein
LAMLRDDIHAMRFDNGAGYAYAQTLDNIIVLHGASPTLEGKPSPATDADGRLLTDIPGTTRRDEVGAMAGAALVFKDHMVKVVDLAAAQDQERQRALAEKQPALNDMANKIEAETTTALQQVAGRTSKMTAIADGMSASASRTGSSAQGAAAASAQALANAQMVASAAEQLSVS